MTRPLPAGRARDGGRFPLTGAHPAPRLTLTGTHPALTGTRPAPRLPAAHAPASAVRPEPSAVRLAQRAVGNRSRQVDDLGTPGGGRPSAPDSRHGPSTPLPGHHPPLLDITAAPPPGRARPTPDHPDHPDRTQIRAPRPHRPPHPRLPLYTAPEKS
ncbi:hypothetical protein ABZ896_07630 [Streptomyces sp. NPDC047072]|uniref:hypothetical protein n=1 Tax=Streptomyces sp. NPDC047072 TaxID=3154809 RepID=UPI0033E4E0D9